MSLRVASPLALARNPNLAKDWIGADGRLPEIATLGGHFCE